MVEVLKEGLRTFFFFFKSFNVSCAMPGSDPVKNNALTHDGIIFVFVFVCSLSLNECNALVLRKKIYLAARDYREAKFQNHPAL